MVDLDTEKKSEWIEDLFFEIGSSPLHLNRTEIRWVSWLNFPEWTTEETVNLMCGIHPSDSKRYEIPEAMIEIQRMLQGEMQCESASPFMWINCADKLGFLDSFPYPVQTWYNEQLAEKELVGGLPLDDSLVPSVVDLEPQVKKTKPRKKLKPFQRDTNACLLLIEAMTKRYKVEYLDELKAIEAWNKIVSGEFQHDLIKNVSPAKTFILLSGEDKVEKKDFLEKYRKRFKLVTKLTNQQD